MKQSDYSLGLKFLRRSSSVLARTLYPRRKVFRYTKNIYIGVDDEGRKTSLNFKRARRIIILGGTDSGKTYMTRSIMDRCFKAKIIPVVLGDLKPNFYSSIYPIPDGEARLMKDEVPSGLPLKIYYPNFFHHFLTPTFNFEYFPLNFTLSDLNVSDFMELLSITISDEQRVLIERIWQKYDDILSLTEAIKNEDAFRTTTKRSIVNALLNLEKYEIIGNDNHDIVSDINNNKVPVLCLAGEDSLGPYKHFMTTYVSILLRKIMNAAMQKKLKKKIIIILDEAPRYCSAYEDTPLKRQIIECVDLGREWGISMLFTAQFFNSIPPHIFTQSRYILLSFNTDEDTAVSVFKKFALIDSPPNIFKSDVREIIGDMEIYKSGQRDWMLVDTFNRTYTILKPFSPLSKHMHERVL